MVRNGPDTTRTDRRSFLKVGAAGTLAMTGLAGCTGNGGGGGGSTGGSGGGGSTGGSGGGGSTTIRAFLWEGYEPVVSAFEDETGITVKQENATSTNNMFTKTKNAPGRYDLVTPNSGFAARFRDAGLVQPLADSKSAFLEEVPNYGNTYDYFQQGIIAQHLSDSDGAWYGAPPRFGLYGLAHDSRDIDGSKLQSSADIWDNRSEWENDLGINVDEVHSITHAVRAAGHTDKMRGEQIEVTGQAWQDTREKYLELAQFTRAQFESEAQVGRALKSDSYNVAVGPGRNDIINLIKKGNDDFVYTNPSEGAIGWTEAMLVPKQSENADAAKQFMNFILRPEIGAQLATADLAPSVVAGAKNHMSDREIELFFIPPEQVEDVIQDKPFANPQKWKNLQNEFKAAL